MGIRLVKSSQRELSNHQFSIQTTKPKAQQPAYFE